MMNSFYLVLLIGLASYGCNESGFQGNPGNDKTDDPNDQLISQEGPDTSLGQTQGESGDIGIKLELKNGQKLLIGTKKENEAKQVLVNYNTKIKTS